jgi:hypothetical protein
MSVSDASPERETRPTRVLALHGEQVARCVDHIDSRRTRESLRRQARRQQ